jgi:hypothetical protein
VLRRYCGAREDKNRDQQAARHRQTRLAKLWGVTRIWPCRSGSHNSLHTPYCNPLTALAKILGVSDPLSNLLIRHTMQLASVGVAFCLSSCGPPKWAFSRSGLGEITQVTFGESPTHLSCSGLGRSFGIPVPVHQTPAFPYPLGPKSPPAVISSHSPPLRETPRRLFPAARYPTKAAIPQSRANSFNRMNSNHFAQVPNSGAERAFL